MPEEIPDTIVTVLDRLVAAGLSPERAQEHLRSGRVQVDGESVTNGEQAAPPPARLVLVTG